MQTRLVLIRHGQVDPTWHGRIYGSHDVALSPLGEEQARTAAEQLRSFHVAAVVSSPLLRASFGARCIASGRGVEHHTDPGLREIDRGDWVGESVLALENREPLSYGQWMRNPSVERPPGGENLADLTQRVFPRLDHWAERYEGQSLAIVAHSWVIRSVLCEVLQVPLNHTTRLRLDTGAMCAVDWSRKDQHGADSRRRCLVGLGITSVPDLRSWFTPPVDSEA